MAKIENLASKSLEELIEVVKVLKRRGDKLDREISIAYFYVGKKSWEWTIIKSIAFFGPALKVYLTYKGFSSSEERIRKAKRVPAITWLRDLSQEKFSDFLERLEQWKAEEEEYWNKFF